LFCQVVLADGLVLGVEFNGRSQLRAELGSGGVTRMSVGVEWGLNHTITTGGAGGGVEVPAVFFGLYWQVTVTRQSLVSRGRTCS
jgi:hypothetical protein